MYVLVIIAIVVALVIVVIGVFFNREARVRRALRKAPVVKIQSFPDNGVAKIVGELRFVAEPLAAPLSGRRCAYWEVIVSEYRKSGKSGGWREIIRQADHQDFQVDDGSGVAHVRVVSPSAAIHKDVQERSGTFDDATPQEEAFLSSQGTESTGLLGFNRRLRYREGVLSEGEVVAVLGQGRREPDPSGTGGGYREMPTRLVIDAPEQGPLLLSDELSALGET